MKREILLHHEATAIASKHGLGGLYEYAKYLHEQVSWQKAPEQTQLPSVEFAFFFNPACGEGGIIQATVGASHEEDGLEGCLYRFNQWQSAEAQAAILAELGELAAEVPALKLVNR